jgi:lysophospholipase L1-like esterase
VEEVVNVLGDLRPPRRYVALGASDTQGGGASAPGKGYVPQLFHRLAATGGSWELYNVGCSGVLIDHLIKYQLPAAVSVSPDVITLWTGGNDAVKGDLAESFAVKLDYLLTELRTRTTAVIVVGNLPEMHRQPFALKKSARKQRRLRDRSAAFNAALEEAAARHGAAVADLWSGDLMYDAKNFSGDGLHPNDAGYAGIAERFWAALEEEWKPE